MADQVNVQPASNGGSGGMWAVPDGARASPEAIVNKPSNNADTRPCMEHDSLSACT